MSRKSVARFAVRLEGLPWKWVAMVDLVPVCRTVGSDIAMGFDFLRNYLCLSKDAPYTLAVALKNYGGYEFYQGEIEIMDREHLPDLSPTDLSPTNWTKIRGLESFYLPLGFALDVEQWRRAFGDILPEGHWVDFADLTKPTGDGGDQDRWFAAHFVGPCWWVIPVPEEANRSEILSSILHVDFLINWAGIPNC